jgi:hypothetical protein
MTDQVNLKDDGEAEFDVFERATDKPVTYELVSDVAFYEGEADANARFRCQCVKCKSEDCVFVDSMMMGSSWTGMYGHIDIACRACGVSRIIRDS